MKITIPSDVSLLFVSSTTHQHHQIFRKTGTAELFLDILKRYEARGDFHLIAYCIMPDHYHVVLRLIGMLTINQILHNLHSFFVHRYCIQRKVFIRRLWSRHSWIVGIDTEEMYWQKIAYTLLNPYRAGLVKLPLDNYPYSDIREWKKRMGALFMLDLFGVHSRRNE